MRSISFVILATVGQLATSMPAAAQSTPDTAFNRYQEMVTVCANPPIVAAATECKPVIPVCGPSPTTAEIVSGSQAINACISKTLPSSTPVAGLSSSSIAWVPVVTDFLVGRARAELVVFLKERISGAVCGKPVAKKLFAETCIVLTGADDLLSGLPGALRADLDVLPTRLREEAIAHLPSVKDTLRPAACVAIAAWDAYPVLRDHGPIAALRWLAEYSPPDACKPALADAIKWAKVLTPAIEGVIAGTLTATQPIDVPALRAVLRELADSSGFTAPEQERLSAAIPSIVQLIESVRAAVRSGPIDAKAISRAAALFARTITELVPETQRQTFSELLLGIADLASGRYASGIQHVLTGVAAALPGDGYKVLHAVVRYGVLLSSLAAAESDSEVQSILESASAPIGSWREFRRSRIAGFVGGFAGVGAGAEFGVGNAAPAGAPFLPLGLEIGGRLKGTWSWNVLVSVVDLGAVAATRLDDKDGSEMGTSGTARQAPAATFAGVFAPGLFAGIGLGNTPFVLGAGVEYLPASREVFTCPDANACATTRDEPVVRAMVFLAVDLPVLPLFH